MEKNTKKEIKIEDLKKLMDENLKLAKENREMLKKVKKYLLISRIWGFLKILIIVTPIILGIIYLPPLIDDFVQGVKEGLGLNKVEQAIGNFSTGDGEEINQVENQN